jgi:hypothetical protein
MSSHTSSPTASGSQRNGKSQKINKKGKKEGKKNREKKSGTELQVCFTAILYFPFALNLLPFIFLIMP